MEKKHSFRLSQPQHKQLQLIERKLQAKNTSDTIRKLIEHADDKKIQKLMTAVVERRELEIKQRKQIRKLNQIGINLNQLIRLAHTYDSYDPSLFQRIDKSIGEIKSSLFLIKTQMEDTKE